MVPANFHHLYYFWIIAKAGSISAATETLLLNQSTLSQQLAQLERALGARLLDRGNRGVTLTPEGRLCFEYCERIFTQAEELLAVLRSGKAGGVPFIRVGVIRSVAREKVLAFMERIGAEDPGVLTKLVSGSGGEMEASLVARLVDLVLSDIDLAPRMGGAFRSRLVGSVPHFFVASTRLRGGAGGLAGALARNPLVLRPPGNPLRQDVDHFLRSNGIAPNVAVEVDDPDIILAMVLRGHGIGLLEPHAIEPHLSRRRLFKLHRDHLGIRGNLWLVCGAQPHGNARVSALLERLMEGFRFDPGAVQARRKVRVR